MIKFIDLREYDDIDGKFAFFDTMNNEFMDVVTKSVWHTFYEFKTDVKNGRYMTDYDDIIHDCWEVCPPWTLITSDDIIDRVMSRRDEFAQARMNPQYIIMNGETRELLHDEIYPVIINECIVTDGFCGLKVIMRESMEYGDVAVVGEPCI